MYTKINLIHRPLTKGRVILHAIFDDDDGDKTTRIRNIDPSKNTTGWNLYMIFYSFFSATFVSVAPSPNFYVYGYIYPVPDEWQGE